MLHTLRTELKHHIPLTLAGTLGGIALIVVGSRIGFERQMVAAGFWACHPLHVLLSAAATVGMYRRYAHGRIVTALIIGYLGSVGIGTLSDSLIPFVGEVLLDLPERHVHIGFIEKWWLVNPLALLGIGIALVWPIPSTRVPHAGHVLLSTAASLFHVMMAVGGPVSVVQTLVLGLFLFLAVWIPCCTSDIVFPILFAHPRHGRHHSP